MHSTFKGILITGKNHPQRLYNTRELKSKKVFSGALSFLKDFRRTRICFYHQSLCTIDFFYILKTRYNNSS